jgi:hypothetical protein
MEHAARHRPIPSAASSAEHDPEKASFSAQGDGNVSETKDYDLNNKPDSTGNRGGKA